MRISDWSADVCSSDLRNTSQAAAHLQDPPMTRAARTQINDQFELFLPYIADMPLRDQREMMERPFFSLAKTKRVKPIDYTSPDGKAWVHVSANPDYGMATIWDADLLRSEEQTSELQSLMPTPYS